MEECSNESSKQYALIPQSSHSLEKHASIVDVREEMIAVYEHYCTAYPNPDLALENEERDRLLLAISAADHAVQVNPKKKQRRGFFGSIFGSSKEQPEDRRVQVEADDERLNYSPTEVPPDDAWLLGTEFSLDTSNIPDEAHSVARQHLLARQPNIVRGSTAVLVHFGVLAWDGEMVTLPYHGSAAVSVAHTRAALVHPTLMAVSWGATDTDIVLYEQKSTTTANWQPVARLGPTRAVQEHLLNTEWDFDNDNSTLLAVTDLLALDAGTLVVARLGGFLEILLLDQPQQEPIAVTTSEYHVDVLGVELVGDNILAAHGRTVDHHQVITFWLVGAEGGVTLLQEIDLDRMGPDVSVFCTPTILQHWRKPRSVSLRDKDSEHISQSESSITTISVSAPIVSLQCREGRYLAILDWNGGLSVLDCDFANTQFQILRSRSFTPHLGVQAVQWIDDALVTVNRNGHLLWKNTLIASIPPHAVAVLYGQQMVVQHGSQLRVCSIQELTASAIVQSFVMNEQYAEALFAAQRLGDTERQTIHEDVERCKKILWERDGDIEILAQIRDDPYVIQQALGKLTGIDFAGVCRLALQRMKITKLGSSLKVASSVEEFREIGTTIQDRLWKYGSYILLCSHLSVQPKLSPDFYDGFLNISVTELSHQFARRGDIISASIIWIRHMSELDTLALLNEIPLSIPPFEYGHMLPTLQPGSFLNGLDEVSELSLFPSYFSDRFECYVVTDDEDESMIVERTPQSTPETEVIVAWYTKRAAAIYEFVPTLTCISQFGQLAVLALGSDFVSQAGVFVFSSYAKSLLELVSADHLETDIIPTLVSLTQHNVDSLSVSSLVAVALDPEYSVEAMQDRFHNVLVPMLQTVAKDDSTSLVEQLDHAVVTLGRNILERSQRSDTVESNLLVEQAKECSRIVWGCRSSLPKRQRLISRRTVICRFVLDAVDGVLSMLSATDDIKLSDQMQIVDILWNMYEALPVGLDGDELVETAGELDHLYNVLVALDLCSRWPSAMKHFSGLSHRRIKVGQYAEKSLVSAICFAACSQLKCATSLDQHVLVEFVESFLGDLQTIESTFVNSTLDIRSMVKELFIQPVLQLEQVEVLALLLEKNFLKPGDIVSFVLETFKEAVYGDGNISLATKLREKLSPFFPELIQEFSASTSFLDATSHIQDILVPDGSLPFSPRELRETPSLEVVEAVLSKNPQCVVQQCTRWRDPDWSRRSNEKIRHHLRGGSHFGSADLPPLPAMPVYHLAQLLSLEGVSSVIAVKSKVIHHAVRAELFGAAAAVCRTLLVDTYNNGTDPGPALSGVKEIVSANRYEDDETKKELCEVVFLHASLALSREATSAFNAIVDSWFSLEYNGVDRERVTKENTVRGFLSYMANEDETRIQDLLVNLRSELEETTLENNLLEALSASSALWFTNSTSSKPRPESTASFSVSLLLHIAEEDQALQALSRLQATLPKPDSYSCRAVRTRPQDIAPNHSIVSGLMSRGYSQNGACRATIATENEGFDQALQWAVAHSADIGFDDPIVLLRDRDADLPLAGGDLNRFCAALKKLNLTFRRGPVHNEPQKPPETVERSKPEDSSWDGGEWSDFEDEEDPSDNNGDTGESISDGQQTTTQSSEIAVVSSTVQQGTGHTSKISDTVSDASAIERNFGDGVDLRKPFVASLKESSLNASLPRSMLLQVGQAAFQNAKKVRSPTNEERQRLIEQGRAFFRQVHASSDSLVGPSSPTNNLEREATVAGASNNDGDDWDFEDDLSL